MHTWLVVIFTLRFVIKAELNTLKQMDEKSICKTYFTTGICGYIVYKESKKLRNDEKKRRNDYELKKKKKEIMIQKGNSNYIVPVYRLSVPTSIH